LAEAQIALGDADVISPDAIRMRLIKRPILKKSGSITEKSGLAD
jgi:hypothetical protein